MMSERARILLPSDKQFDLLDPDLWARTDDHLQLARSPAGGTDIRLATCPFPLPITPWRCSSSARALFHRAAIHGANCCTTQPRR